MKEDEKLAHREPELEPLHQDRAQVREGDSCLLYVLALAAMVWESLFSLLMGEFEAR